MTLFQSGDNAWSNREPNLEYIEESIVRHCCTVSNTQTSHEADTRRRSYE